jgi:hypothetical protein
VLQGHTKTGKPKYNCARRENAVGAPVEQLPAGIEIHERPEDAMVSIRKVRPSRILPFEREKLAQWADQLAGVPVLLDLDGDHLIVYAADTDPEASLSAMSLILGASIGDNEEQREWIVRHTRYSPMFRFTLKDENQRLYSVDRWCYLGSIDRWFSLAEGEPLETVAQTYLPHLGQESFFELM